MRTRVYILYTYKVTRPMQWALSPLQCCSDSTGHCSVHGSCRVTRPMQWALSPDFPMSTCASTLYIIQLSNFNVIYLLMFIHVCIIRDNVICIFGNACWCQVYIYIYIYIRLYLYIYIYHTYRVTRPMQWALSPLQCPVLGHHPQLSFSDV